MRGLSILLLLLTGTISFAQQRLTKGSVITHSTQMARATYDVPSPGDERAPAAIVIQGNGLTVDFGGSTLRGTAPTVDPDQRKGVGIQVQGKSVTIRNLYVRGYKVGLIARNCPGLKIVNCDFSYNWKQHLHSTPEREDLSDWMSYHDNEKDEWLGYGAGIYLRGCDGFTVKGVKVEDGQCGLMLTQCNHGLVWNSDFSFLSGIGVGMYRSSDNRVMNNRIDWCVRGYSHGVYNRGQDSAGILVYEQSNRNTFAYNSVTQGGDGFFLWAGQSTMDSGQGGCNDNVVYGNDFSSAPTNGIEATFSRNVFANNLVLECWHGMWGGYSHDSVVTGNLFGSNAEGIAWEHGHDNVISKNVFLADGIGVNIWANPNQDPNWGYPKHTETRSLNWRISENLFGGEATSALRLRDTASMAVTQNLFGSCKLVLDDQPEPDKFAFSQNVINTSDSSAVSSGGTLGQNNAVHVSPSYRLRRPSLLKPDGNAPNSEPTIPAQYLLRFKVPWKPYPTRSTNHRDIDRFAPPALSGAASPFVPKGALRGRRYILVDQWGPYDFKSPKMCLRSVSGVGAGRKMRFEILGPRGKWRVASRQGIVPQTSQGSVPGWLEARTPANSTGLTQLVLVYTGSETTDYRGLTSRAGAAVKFGYSAFQPNIDWGVRFYKWGPSSDPRTQMEQFHRVTSGTPVARLKTDSLDFGGYGFAPGVPNDYFATIADGSFAVPVGNYTVNLTTDDGAKLWLDGKVLIDDAWHYQGPTLYTRLVHLGPGRHAFHVEHFQIDGYAALKVNIEPVGSTK